MKKMRRARVLTGSALAGLLVLSGCSQASPTIPTDPKGSDLGTITISSGISSETEIVANIYAQALERAGYTVEVTDTGDSRDDYLTAMESPRDSSGAEESTDSASASDETVVNDPTTVDITPDYSGNLLLKLTNDGEISPSDIEKERQEETESPTPEPTETLPGLTQSPTPSPTGSPLNIRGMNGNDITSTLDRVLPTGLSLLDAASAENKDALVVTRVTAARYDISTINDLAQYCGKLTFGGPESFSTRSYGLPGLAENYSCKPAKFIGEDSQQKLADNLAEDTVQVADIYTSSPDIVDNKFIVLEDTQNNFIAQNIVPVVRENELPSTAKDTINTVSANLKTTDLVQLNRLTTGEHSITTQEAAKFWLDHLTE